MADTNQKDPKAASGSEENLFQWNYQIKMLFNPTLWKTFFVIFGIPIALLGLVLKFIAKIHPVLLPMAGIFVFFFVIWVITGIMMDLMGGFLASYRLTSKGIYFTSGKNEKNIADAVTVIGALTGKPGMAGAGLLARAEQSNFIDWAKVKKVKVRAGSRYIFIREGFGCKPVGLYCTKENFHQVLDIVRSHCQGVKGL